MKIGIISEFSLHTVNYGNHLQAYALNQYLKKCYPDYTIESIPQNQREVLKKHRTNLFLSVFEKFKRIIMIKKKALKSGFYNERNRKFFDFANEYISMPGKNLTWEDLRKSDYDILITGSDVVWYQRATYVAREKFLDFTNTKKAKKIAYGASFGRDYIPVCNKRFVQNALRSFSAISVRERSSVKLLKSIGINGAVHVCDPTMLLSEDEWKRIEKMPDDVQKQNGLDSNDIACIEYVFAYFLGASEQTWDTVTRFCAESKLKLVTIPHAKGCEEVKIYGDYIVPACSPEEWIWLIHHATHVITDSFHGIVFSTIFKKPFNVVERKNLLNGKDMGDKINNRLLDYMDFIGQKDKLCSCMNSFDVSAKRWNYTEIRNKMNKLIEFSKKYIEENI